MSPAPTLPQPLSTYRCVVFDCDGVLLDSNPVKTEAFRQAALPYGIDAAAQLVDYHQRFGGISREAKFHYFFTQLLGYAEPPPDHLSAALTRYADRVQTGLFDCRTGPGVFECLQNLTKEATAYVVSGGNEKEVRQILHYKDLGTFFTGIYGSPRSKQEILATLAESGRLPQPGLFVGDARYDYECASVAGLDFAFIWGMTESPDWKTWVTNGNLPAFEHVGELLR